MVSPRKKSTEQERATRAAARILRGAFFADLIQDPRTRPTIWHCIVQRSGSPEILYWEQETTFEQAEALAKERLHQLLNRERHKQAGAGS